MARHLLSKSLEDLEHLVADQQRNEQVLRDVLAELEHRRTERASLLRSRVRALLNVAAERRGREVPPAAHPHAGAAVFGVELIPFR